MAGLSLLTLLDDITAVLDDVAAMTKVAAKKTAGVLGDDLALNAQQVSGVNADRELPVVWAVAKGSFLNKLIIVPVALILSVVFPPAIIVLLMLGGLFLCFEGFEKVFHVLFHKGHSLGEEGKREHLKAVANLDCDLVAFEKKKIKGAIRTDFILSAEIIVIALGSVTDQLLLTKILVVSFLAIALTIVVYGLVAAIVKLDDLGLFLLTKSKEKENAYIQRVLGKGFLGFAPLLMRFLVVVGTAAMFLVGGGIIIHGVPVLSGLAHDIEYAVKGAPPIFVFIVSTLNTALVGIVAGGVVMSIVSVFKRFFAKK